MAVVAALSQHPAAVDATAEVIGLVLDDLSENPDLAVLFTSPQHADAFADIAATVRTALSPGRLIGITASGILGGPREVEDGPAVSLWAARLGMPPEPVRLTAVSTVAGVALQGLPHPSDLGERTDDDGGPGPTLVLLADPFSVPVPDMLDVLAESPAPLRVVGGLASAGMAPGANRMVLDDQVYADGAVGVVLDHRHGGHGVVVSQGCRPIGAPMIVTRSDGAEVLELAGQPALTRLQQLVAQAQPDDRELLASGLHLGVVADEHQTEFGRGDFLIRNVVGADRQTGALSVGALVDVGTTVQFQVRDAASAHEDLFDLLDGFTCSGALVFTCNGRGTNLFDTSHHDAGLVAEVTKNASVAGMFCAGEIGPVGPRSFLHGFTACVLLVQ